MMPFIEHDLKTLLADMPAPFVQSEVKTIMLQLLSAVEFCHANWIVSLEICINSEPTLATPGNYQFRCRSSWVRRAGRDCVSSPAPA